MSCKCVFMGCSQLLFYSITATPGHSSNQQQP